MKRKKPTQPKVRNWTAVAAHQRRADTFGGSPKQQNRRDRKAARRIEPRRDDA